MKDRVFAVFGLGAFGSEICRSLSERGARVIAIDNQPRLIERIKEDVTQALLLDSTDEEALSGAPLEDIDVAVVAIGDDIEASILTTALLKSMGIPFIRARAVTDIHLKVLKQVGADEVVNLAGDFLASGAAVDRFLADQLLIYMAIAGAGSYTTNELSAHLTTNIETIKKFLPVDFRTEQQGRVYRISVDKRQNSQV